MNTRSSEPAMNPVDTVQNVSDIRLVCSPIPLSRVSFLTLRNPRSDNVCTYGFNDAGGDLFELVIFDEDRSLFMNDFVVENGSMFILSPIHSVFLALPYLIKASKCFVPVCNLIDDAEFPLAQKLLTSKQLLRCLPNICDVKMACGVEVLRLNDDKLLHWLRERVNNIVKEVKSSDDFPKNVSVEMYACGILADYLPGSIENAFFKFMGLELDVAKKAEGVGVESVKAKAATANGAIPEPFEDYSKGVNFQPAKKIKLTTVQKQLQKASVGTKSLTTFFQKANK